MFNVNDTIIYGSEGVCRIVGIEENDFVGVKKTYYLLKPISKSGSITYVPVDSEALVAKMHRLLSKEEINSMIDSLPDAPPQWIANERKRKEAFKSILAGGNRVELLQMIHTIYLEKQNRASIGKRLHIADERFLNDAEQCLYGEFQYVLNIAKEEIVPYIISRVEKKIIE